jgi:hypothetical protein
MLVLVGLLLFVAAVAVGSYRAYYLLIEETCMRLPLCFLAPLSRERDRIRAEMQAIQGLLPLLMKQRNGSRWTSAERAQLRGHLRNLRSLGPYLLVLLAPGSFVLFPLLAWWLDRRRQKRNHPGQTTPVAIPATTEGNKSSTPTNL